jgi:hypothetical protein
LADSSSSSGQQTDLQVTLLKKAQDQMTQQGQAMVQLIEQTPNAGEAPARRLGLDTYA